MKNRLFHYLAPLLSLFIFALALWALHSALRQYHYQDILAELRQMPMDRILIGLALTVLSYLIMIGYEYLALRYIRRPLELRKIAFASFMSYALSNNTGQALLSGGSMRFRLYTAWGLSAGEIAQVVAFCHLTFWVGFCAIGGIVFLVEPVAVPASVYLPGFIADWTGVKEIPLPPRALHYIGAAFVVIAVIYLLLSAFRKSPVKIWQWEFPVPGIKLAVSQLVIVSVDLIIAASVLYVLIPSSLKMDYSLFVGIYLLSIFVGMVSMVPGGLGVFETILILFLSSYIPTTSLVGSLLVYRGLYYILPLITATIMLGVHESLQRYQHVMRVVAYFGKWDSLVAPHLFAFLAFGAGTMLLFSGAVPGEVERLRWLGTMIPLPVLEGSHFLGSLAGVGLLFVARGLQRRLDAAYIFTALLYIAGIVFSLLKGWEFEEALILGLLLGALLPCRAFFYRKSRLTAHPLAIGWIVAIGLVLAASIWLGIFSHKHVDYSHELWWKFELSADAPRFLRASVGTSALTLFLAFSWLLRPAQPEPAIPPPEELEDAMPIIAQFPHTYANLALLGDKPLLFSDDYNAFLMYGIEGRSWVAMGDPVGPKQELRELVWRFREMCDRHDGIPVFYQVHPDFLELYLDLGLTLLKFGEEARVDLAKFALEGRAHKGMRHTVNMFQREGFVFEVLPAEAAADLLPELREVSDEWLERKHTREKGFSLGYFKEDYLRRFPCAVVRREDRIAAFANVWLGGGMEEASVDLMRYSPDAPSGVMDFLFVELMLWAKERGYKHFNLGMAPLAGLEDRALAPLWNRLGALVFRHGEHFYNFQGLREYKDKFDPEWEPRYLVSPGGLALPRVLTNIASLIARGTSGILMK